MSSIRAHKRAIAAAILSMGFGLAATAQTAGSTSTSPSSTTATAGTSGSDKMASKSGKESLARADRKFVEEAAIGGMAEVELGNLAQQKAANEQVKQFASRMVQDHSKANDQLKQIASAKGIEMPSAVDKKHQKDMDKLQKLSGADFDREYMKHMVSDHKKDVSEFQKAAKSAKDSDLKSFAGSTLPTLQEHLKLAQSTNDAVKNDKSNRSSTSGTGATGSTSGTSATGSPSSTGSAGATGSTSSTGSTGTKSSGSKSSAGSTDSSGTKK